MLIHLTEGLGHHVAMELDTGKLVKWAQGRLKDGGGAVALNMEVSKLGTILRHTASLKNLRLPDVIGQARPTLQRKGCSTTLRWNLTRFNDSRLCPREDDARITVPRCEGSSTTAMMKMANESRNVVTHRLMSVRVRNLRLTLLAKASFAFS